MSYDPHFPPPEHDPLRPESPPPLDAPLSHTGMTEKSGLPRNIAAALACIFPILGGIAFYIIDRRDRYVRFYALQSIVLGGVFFVLGVATQIATGILRFIPLVGERFFVPLLNLLSSATGVLFVILWVFLIWNAYRGKLWEMPVIWRLAKRHIPAALL